PDRRVYVWFLFFFSSRRRHTRSKRDWSSDVCSSDLCSTVDATRNSVDTPLSVRPPATFLTAGQCSVSFRGVSQIPADSCVMASRSEERRVGKECRSRRSP